ncbi:MAG: hypothetical protein PHV02_03220 [Rhodocyclaceae bacterium]|nr:hypothetical protein [Rhodocyclaceae bacterium]
MHQITIQKTKAGLFDVLLNGHAYKVHSGLTEQQAIQTATEAQRQFRVMRQRSTIKRKE